VVVITAGFRNRAFNLLGDQLAFTDDEEHRGGVVRGYFNADLLPHFGLEPFERCFVLVSLGPHLSNVVEVKAGDGEGTAGY
jgi:hypothetical protein